MPNLFGRIAIGCANWNQPYNGSQLSDKDITKVLGYCQTSGIDTLDMATAYDNDFSRPNSYFKKVIKVRMCDDIPAVAEAEPYCIMAHGLENNECLDGTCLGCETTPYAGISVYEPHELKSKGLNFGIETHIVQLPYSLYDRRFEPYFDELYSEGVEIHVRSIFLRGRILKDGIDPQEAIKFVLANRYVDKVILGVASFDELRRNLDFLFRWQNLERHDEELLDTRRW